LDRLLVENLSKDNVTSYQPMGNQLALEKTLIVCISKITGSPDIKQPQFENSYPGQKKILMVLENMT